jgi:hypothetical protein
MSNEADGVIEEINEEIKKAQAEPTTCRPT